MGGTRFYPDSVGTDTVPTINSAVTFVLPTKGNRIRKDKVVCVVHDTNTSITNIAATGEAGTELTMIFDGTQAGAVVETGNIKLSAAFNSTADDTMVLVCDGTSWFEAGRSAN